MRAPLARLPRTAIGLLLFLGIGAIGGGLALMAGPGGEILPLPPSALAGSPFSSYFIPGAILFTVLGIGPAGVAVLAWRESAVAPFLTFLVGGTLLVWIVVEIMVVGYANKPPLQAIYLALGVVTTVVGIAWLRKADSTRVATSARSLT